MKKISVVLILLFTCVTFISNAQGYKVGDTVKDFSLLNIDGRKVSLAQDDEKLKGYILIFTCNHCPYSVAYQDRIIGLHAQFANLGFPVLAINSNDAEQYPEDSYDGMVVRAQEKQFLFPYLYDETQVVAKQFGATKTPHVYLLSRVGNAFIVKYIGAIDDNYESSDKVTVNYIADAIDLLLENKEVKVSFTKAIGCSIKWKK